MINWLLGKQDAEPDILRELQDFVNTTGRLPVGTEITDFAGAGYSDQAVNLFKTILAKSIKLEAIENGKFRFLLILEKTYTKAIQSDLNLILDPELRGLLSATAGSVTAEELSGFHGEHGGMQGDITEADMKKRSDGNNDVHAHVQAGWFQSDENAELDKSGHPVKQNNEQDAAADSASTPAKNNVVHFHLRAQLDRKGNVPFLARPSAAASLETFKAAAREARARRSA
jgi:hypothetical protein